MSTAVLEPGTHSPDENVATKYVYSFGPWGAEGNQTMKNSLGGKGANLAEMCHLKLPVPAGFTISTEYCTVYLQGGKTVLGARSRKRSKRPSPAPRRRWARNTAMRKTPSFCPAAAALAVRCPA